VNTSSGDIFQPNKVAVGIGGQVTWTFGATIHNVTFAPQAGAADEHQRHLFDFGLSYVQQRWKLQLFLHDPRRHERPGRRSLEQGRS
jgi:plastocyanin